MKKTVMTLLRGALFFGVGFTILFLVYKSQNTAFQEQCRLDGIPADQCNLLKKVWTDFCQANLFWIFLMLVAFMLSNVSRAIRWNMLLRPMGYRPRLSNSFWMVMLGYFANLGLPRLGEVVRAGALARYEKIPAEKVMGTVVTDRVFDVLCLLLFVASAFILEFNMLMNWLNENATGGSGSLFSSPLFWGFMAAGLIGMGLIWLFRKQILQIPFFQKIAKMAMGFKDGVLSVRKVESPFWFVFHSLFIWTMYFMMAYLCFFAFEPTSVLSINAALIVFVFGTFGIVIPSPGGMGTYHFLAIQALGLYGIAGDDAFSFANIIYFAIQIFANILFGLLALILLPFLNKNYRPAHVPIPENEIIKP